jgi:hypothetical protein
MIADIAPSKDKREHNWYKVAIIYTNLIVYIAMVGFNIIASFPNSGKRSIFPSDVGGQANNFYLDVTPASWVFSSVWTVIFVWNFSWLVYAFVNIFRTSRDGEVFYRRYDIFHFLQFFAFIFNNVCIIAWLFLWTNAFAGVNSFFKFLSFYF